MRANSPNITANEMGPWEGVEHESFQAVVGQLGLICKAMPWHLHCRPMRPHWSAAIPANHTL